MTIHEAMSEILGRVQLTPSQTKADEELAGELLDHRLYPLLLSRTKFLYEQNPNGTINMLLRLGYDIGKMADGVPEKTNDVSWCEALFRLPTNNPSIHLDVRDDRVP